MTDVDNGDNFGLLTNEADEIYEDYVLLLEKAQRSGGDVTAWTRVGMAWEAWLSARTKESDCSMVGR